MTQRSILAGPNPTVIIKSGGSITVRGVEGERVSAESSDRWGLQLEKTKGKEKQIARARAAVGDHVLFDLRFKMPNPEAKSLPEEVIEIQFGGNGEVLVPFGANVKAYAGRDLDVQGLQGYVDVFSGGKLLLRNVYGLGSMHAGGNIDIDCQTMQNSQAEFKAGGDIRFCVRDLTSVRLRVKDLGGYWEAQIGTGEKSVYLKSGGDVTLVTDQAVEALPPNYVLGKIETPSE